MNDNDEVTWRRLRSLVEAGDVLSDGYRRAARPVRSVYWSLAIGICAVAMSGVAQLGIAPQWVRVLATLAAPWPTS